MLEQDAVKRGMDIEKLKAEQRKLAKLVVAKDSINFDTVKFIAGISTFIDEKSKSIIVGIVVTDENLEVVEQRFVKKRLNFPYITGFRSYRELKAIVECYNKLEVRPDVIFIKASGILHPRGLGLASHLGLAVDNSVIGITNSPLCGDLKNDKVYLKGKIKARLLSLKQGSKPVVVSVGHNISLNTAVALTKKFTVKPNKLPKPLALANKYVKKVAREFSTREKVIET